MDRKEQYAAEWNSSAEYFSNNGDYDWMETHLHKYHTVLEIGCGTGHSTLSLLENGHKVICVEKNGACIAFAKKLIEEHGYSSDTVIFLEGDILDFEFLTSTVEELNFDVICCWNPGTVWEKNTLLECAQLFQDFGFTTEDIKHNPEGSYVELLFLVCAYYAKKKGVPFHIIDRGRYETDSRNDVYYHLLKDEVGLSDIFYDNKRTESLSAKGRVLAVNSKPLTGDYIDVVLISVLMK